MNPLRIGEGVKKKKGPVKETPVSLKCFGYQTQTGFVIQDRTTESVVLKEKICIVNTICGKSLVGVNE